MDLLNETILQSMIGGAEGCCQLDEFLEIAECNDEVLLYHFITREKMTCLQGTQGNYRSIWNMRMCHRILSDGIHHPADKYLQVGLPPH